MSDLPPTHAANTSSQDLVAGAALSGQARSLLTRLAAWLSDRNVAFLVISVGMIVMLLWAVPGSVPGRYGPNSPQEQLRLA
jgi:membrane-bound ClpP family serine protease